MEEATAVGEMARACMAGEATAAGVMAVVAMAAAAMAAEVKVAAAKTAARTQAPQAREDGTRSQTPTASCH